MKSLLDSIHSPKDLKGLSSGQLKQLCSEIRTRIIHTVASNGGHLASNLGVVELTVALHRVFNSEDDRIVWDVGHQSYTHKMLTGRGDRISTIRTKGGLSGFPNRQESPCDPFTSGHSSTSISSALGLAEAKQLSGQGGYVVAVIGDGALTGGLAYEGLNNAGRFKKNFIVVLNDNKMSISRNVGSMARYLAKIRTEPSYLRIKGNVEKTLDHIPGIGKHLNHFITRSKSVMKHLMYNSTIFEDMGFYYYGPFDGHDVDKLIEVFTNVKSIDHPVLLHVITQKGKGYPFAEQNPGAFHGVSRFNIETGKSLLSVGTNFSTVFGDTLCELAEKDKRICGVTAAMQSGTGLSRFAEKFPKRFFDTGIAEEHAVTFCGGLAVGGMLPVFAVYSSFLQRGYDQLIHDVALQGVKVVLAVDRAGIVGEDGQTHQGIFDAAYFNTIPGAYVYSPSYFDELKICLRMALYENQGLAVVRYPRGGQLYRPFDFLSKGRLYDCYGSPDAKVAIVTYGRLFSYACEALSKLKQHGIDANIVKLNRIRPIDAEAVHTAAKADQVFFFEEGIAQGGVGEHFCFLLKEAGFSGKFHLRAIENFVPQSTMAEALNSLGLDDAGMLKMILTECANNGEKRLDCLVYEHGFSESREKAKIDVMVGNVYVNGQKEDKPGTMLPVNVKIEVRGKALPYVSRGGLKLEKALQSFPIDLHEKTVMDIGASTGGFTDCMLQNGAAKVYSIDVGYGQLAWKLRTDPRVVNLERTNVRYLTSEQVPEEVDFFSVDVAFISLKLVLPVARRFLKDGGQAVCLIKPQFEAGREKVGKKGVVRDKSVHAEVIRGIVDFVLQNGFSVLGLTFSPVKGPEGNIEYLLYLQKSETPSGSIADEEITALVEQSHKALNGGEAK